MRGQRPARITGRHECHEMHCPPDIRAAPVVIVHDVVTSSRRRMSAEPCGGPHLPPPPLVVSPSRLSASTKGPVGACRVHAKGPARHAATRAELSRSFSEWHRRRPCSLKKSRKKHNHSSARCRVHAKGP